MSDDSKTPKLHITAIGGLEEVGKNLTVFQYKNEILVVDCGLRFAGPHLPGVDYLINDFSYLEANRDKIVGLIITHGHLDHIGAIPFFLKKINVPVYATPFTRAMIEKMVLDKAPEVRWKHRELKAGKMHHIGSFHVEPIHVNHSIIQSLAFAITTPVGVVIHSGDFKIDMSTSYEETTDLAKFTEYGDKGVLALLSDSTNAINPGYTVSEGSLPANFEKIVAEAKGRVIVGTFSSQIHRIQMIIDLCKKVGRRIFVSGRSMLQNLEIGVGLSLFKNYQEVLVLDSEIKRLPKEKILILSTGSQGEETAGLSLMIANKHKVIKLDKE
ncbi:MAG: ribonuclease J, partial [Spirochaetia bacterium]|nr:ribonuclease J [Spirochaetia bacterium]